MQFINQPWMVHCLAVSLVTRLAEQKFPKNTRKQRDNGAKRQKEGFIKASRAQCVAVDYLITLWTRQRRAVNGTRVEDAREREPEPSIGRKRRRRKTHVGAYVDRLCRWLLLTLSSWLFLAERSSTRRKKKYPRRGEHGKTHGEGQKKLFIKFVTNLLVISLSSLRHSTLSSERGASERFMRFAVAIERSKRLNLFWTQKQFREIALFAKILRTHLNNIGGRLALMLLLLSRVRPSFSGGWEAIKWWWRLKDAEALFRFRLWRPRERGGRRKASINHGKPILVIRQSMRCSSIGQR